MQSDIAKVQTDMYICFYANQPGINAIWPLVYMHSGNLELCNVTSVINALQHHVKCHFDITTEYLLEVGVREDSGIMCGTARVLR